MVTSCGLVWHFSSLLLAQQPAEPVLERLDPPRRAAVIMALLALVLTGFLLVAIAMLGANWVRRMARYKPGELRSRTRSDAIAHNRRLRESLHAILPEAKSEDTIQIDGPSKETKIGS